MRSLLVGVGAAAFDCDLVLDLGPLHPAAHAGFRLALTIEDDVIVSAAPKIGFMHRGAEKLFEVRDYPAILALANRHDWLGAFTGELGAALAVEELLGLRVPERAIWLRIVLAELTRLSCHLAFAGGAPGAVPAECWALRERVQQLLLRASGSHLHVMIAAVGGLRHDPGEVWLTEVSREMTALEPDLVHLGRQVLGEVRSTAGLAVLNAAAANQFGVSGINARAGGSTLDVRLGDPHYAMLGLDPQSVADPTGDAAARFTLLVAEICAGPQLIKAAAERAARTSGPVGIRLPKMIRAPAGTATSVIETPLGAATWLLDSTGDKVPNRLKLKAPSFATLASLPHSLPGTPMPDLAMALRSFMFVVGDADR